MIVAGKFWGKAFHFEVREQRVFTLMTKDMGDVLSDVFFVDVFQIFNSPEKFHDGFFLDGLHPDKFSQMLSFEGWCIFWFLDVFVEDLFKKGNELFFHFFDGKARAQDSVDSVGTVFWFVKFDQIVSDFRMGEGLIVTDGESTIGSLSQVS